MLRQLSGHLSQNLIEPFREPCERLLLQAERQDKRIGNYGVRCIVGTRPVSYVWGDTRNNAWVVIVRVTRIGLPFGDS
jgi:hypothetical protein